MSDVIDYSAEGIEKVSLSQYTQKAYLDYSMYVILDRALPHIGDGLKPVQRRIIYAMSELGLKASSKHKKSARTVGDVIGKFHPHGDSAAYEAMVLMAQPFSFRYPLVDGQGNWGSPDDPKSFAAMRYTESRLAPFSEVLLNELGQGTVDWQPNFDGTLNEPEVLPAQAPTVLLNGTTGIAVGMATDIPPHNVSEVINATIHLIDNPKSDTAELMQFIQGPDYPTDAEIITPAKELANIYNNGRGSVKMRALYQTEHGDIVIHALPHQVSGAKVLEQIAQQMQQKKLPMVEDLRDESDHENPTRLVIVPKSKRVDVESLMGHLFATTDLEKNYRVNINLIGIDGRPAVKSLPTILSEWLQFRTETTRRRLQHRLDWINRRLHLLDGLLIAFLNIDEVIHIIRTEEKPKLALMERFGLSEAQAEYVLETKLRQLARLEEMKIRAEQEELAAERDKLEKILNSPARMKTLLKKELKAVLDKFGDDRRSPIVARSEAKAYSETDLLSADPITVVLSAKGWIRAAKGHDIDASQLNYKSGDSYASSVIGKSNQMVMVLDSTGRSYSLPAHTLPSARGQGEPLTGRINAPSGCEFVAMLMGGDDQLCLLASDAGYGFFAKLSDLQSKNKAGKAVLTLKPEQKILAPVISEDIADKQVVAITNEGRMLVFNAQDLPVMGKGKGNKVISIPAARAANGEELMIALSLMGEGDTLVVHAGKRHIKLKHADLEHYQGERGRRGNKLPRGFQKVDRIEVLPA